MYIDPRNPTLPAEEASEYVYYDNVAVIDIDKHRWYNLQMVVIEDDDGNLWGFDYMDPATEYQEGQDRFYEDPVPLYRVQPKTITVTTYERA